MNNLYQVKSGRCHMPILDHWARNLELTGICHKSLYISPNDKKQHFVIFPRKCVSIAKELWHGQEKALMDMYQYEK